MIGPKAGVFGATKDQRCKRRRADLGAKAGAGEHPGRRRPARSRLVSARLGRDTRAERTP